MATRESPVLAPQSPSMLSREVSPEDLTNVRLIGSGGFGIVFKATHKRWCIDVALKCAKTSGQLCKSHDSDLSKEADKMKLAQFDFILPLWGYVSGISSKQMNLSPQDQGLCGQILHGGGLSSRVFQHEFGFRHALVMPYMPCGSLQRLLHRCGQAAESQDGGPGLPWPLRSRFVDQIAHGMNYLHALKPHPLLHLDLKPQNVLLDDDYHVKICDFGLSKWREVTGNLGEMDSPTYIKSLCLHDRVTTPDGETAELKDNDIQRLTIVLRRIAKKKIVYPKIVELPNSWANSHDFEQEMWSKTSSRWSVAESTKLYGTLPYMPPEYLQDTHRKPHYTFDVYSFAIVVWEILTLSIPYANAVNEIQFVECIVKENQRPSLNDIPTDRPRPVESLIDLMERCWDSNPKRRPTFYECIKITKPAYNAFKDDILTARQELQTLLSETDQEQCGWGEINVTTKILCPVQETSMSSFLESSVQLTNNTHLKDTPSEDVTGEALNVPVTNRELIKVGQLLGNKWKAVGRALGLREPQLENLQVSYQSFTMDEVAYQMLRTWREREGRGAMKAALKKALKINKVSADDIF